MAPLRGYAGFRYTVGGQPRVHVLPSPLKLLTPGRNRTRFASESVDLSTYSVVTVGNGRNEIEVTLRYNRAAQDLLEMLDHAASGTVLTYYPDLRQSTGYPLWLVGVGREVRLPPDPARFRMAEYAIRVRFRDASASGTSLERLFSPWLFRWEAGMFPAGYSFSRTGAAYYVDFDGTLKSAAENVARISYPLVDGERVPVYMGEGSRTNAFTQSGDLTHANWTASGLSARTANQVAGPFGTLTLDALVEDTSSGTSHGVHQNATMTADATYALSAWVVAGTRTWARLELADALDAGTNFVRAWFNLTTGAVGSSTVGGTGTFVRAYVEDWTHVRAGLYRIVLVGVVGNAVTGITGRLRMQSADAQVAYTGDGESTMYAGHMQIEHGGAASSYIDTTTAAATRNAETLDLPLGFTPQPMTWHFDLVVTGDALFHPANFNGDAMYVGRAGSGNGYIHLDNGDQPGFRVIHVGASGTTTFHNQVAPNATVGDRVEIAIAIDEDYTGTVSYARNGGAVTTQPARTNADGMPSAWAAPFVRIEREMFRSITAVSGVRSLSEMRALL